MTYKIIKTLIYFTLCLQVVRLFTSNPFDFDAITISFLCIGFVESIKYIEKLEL